MGIITNFVNTLFHNYLIQHETCFNFDVQQFN